MARTNRNGVPSANVQALDNLDLDDMFADGGDDLFDGLDIDLGNMDDITATNNVNSDDAKPSETAPLPPSPSPAAEPEEPPKRRKTKRRTTAPAFFDDQDEDLDEEPVKKKKRTLKSTTTKKRGPKKAAAIQDETKTPVAATTKKSKAKSSISPPTAKATSNSAAVTGPLGKLKKLGGVSKNASTKASESGSLAKGATSATAPKPSKFQPSSQTAPHPGLNQSSFCGLLPSKTQFYPFLPALPQEATQKNRKIYALLDKVHTSFMSQLTSPNNPTNGVQQMKQTEFIVQLMQEAFKEEKSSAPAALDTQATTRIDIIGAAVGNARKAIEDLDKTKLAQDLLAVCALLQRQHDFLKQNAANMERWCRDNFSEEEFAEVYLPSRASKKRTDNGQESMIVVSVLSALSGSTCRVKVMCSGFKEPKTGLQAFIPAKSAAAASAESKKAAKPSKKRKSALDESRVSSAGACPAQPISYAHLRPAKRRKAVADMIAHAAHALETDYARRIEQRRHLLAACEKRARDAVEDTSLQMAHTTGMWKWLEEMGYCEDTIDDALLRDRLDVTFSLDWGDLRHEGCTLQTARAAVDDRNVLMANAEPPPSFVDNLLDLLVDEDDCSDSESDGISTEDEQSHGVGEDHADSRVLAELSSLSPEERAHLHLRSVGLSRIEIESDPSIQTRASTAARISQGQSFCNAGETRRKVNENTAEQGGDALETVIETMKADLLQTTRLNHRRGDYLERIARSTLETPKESKCRKLVEADLHARHAILVKRNKETRAKNGKNKNSKHDDLALPW